MLLGFLLLHAHTRGPRPNTYSQYHNKLQKNASAQTCKIGICRRDAERTEPYQFDWSHEHVEIGGIDQVVKVAHLRLCYSRAFFLTAYPRESQEMVFDAHALVHFERNRYSVECVYAGRTVAVRAYATRIVIVAGSVVVGEHDRQFGRYKTAYNPWHYVPALEHKPGALRNGAPFKD